MAAKPLPSPGSRWLVISVFFLSSSINYLDRQALATLAPLFRAQFHLSNADYGWILAAFSLTYAAAAPFAGLLIDRIGLSRGISLAIGLWSLAGISTGFTRGLGGLVACRAWLGLAEAGGIPAAGKAMHEYLAPEERALGNGLNQAAVFLGAMLAPPVATWLAVRYQWRAAFFVTGIAGLLWIPLWNSVARSAPPARRSSVEPLRKSLDVLRQPRMWGFMAANALSMVTYSLWSNWTTLYLVEVNRLTLVQAAYFAWLPPLAAMLGGFAGGWLSLRGARSGLDPAAARTRVCFACAVAGLVAIAIPLAPNAAWSSAGISISILAVSAFSVNLYTLPLDVYEGARAAFAISLLVSAYGAIQAVVSPALGAVIDRFGYVPVCAIASVTSLAAYTVLRATEPRRPGAEECAAW
ncbi:MAG TPA: MFS transporter [Bryobacteraceae bacterium]|nr:MFS transporter [Bryobacteraceae bacterium]